MSNGRDTKILQRRIRWNNSFTVLLPPWLHLKINPFQKYIKKYFKILKHQNNVVRESFDDGFSVQFNRALFNIAPNLCLLSIWQNFEHTLAIFNTIWHIIIHVHVQILNKQSCHLVTLPSGTQLS